MYYPPVHKRAEQWLCVEQSRKLFINKRGEVVLAMYASTRLLIGPFHRQTVNFFQMCIHFGAVKIVNSKSSDKHEPSLTLRVALNKSSPETHVVRILPTVSV